MKRLTIPPYDPPLEPCLSERSFDEHIRALFIPLVGAREAMKEDQFTFVKALTLDEENKCDESKWQKIYDRITSGGERLSVLERQQALAYWNEGGDLPSRQWRLKKENKI